jgi:integrase
MNDMSVIPIRGERIDEYLKVLNRLSGAKFVLLAFLGFRTGLRVSDLLNLKYGAFSKQKDALKIRETKTSKVRVIPIDDEMRIAVERLRAFTFSNQRHFLFTGRDGEKPMCRTTAYRHLRRAGEELGLKRIGTHSLRKTFAVGLYMDSGGDLDFVKDVLNHKHRETTLHSYILSGVDFKQLLVDNTVN